MRRVFLGILLIVLFMPLGRADTAYSDPEGDITSQTLSECDPNFYDCVNDGVREPNTSGFEGNINSGEMDGYYNSFTMENVDLGGGTATQIKVWAYCMQEFWGSTCSGEEVDTCDVYDGDEDACNNSYTESGGVYLQCAWAGENPPGCVEDVPCSPHTEQGWEIDLSFDNGSSWEGDVKGLDCPWDSYGWRSVTYTGSWNQTQINNLAIKTILDVSPANGPGVAYMEEVYVEITYGESATTLEGVTLEGVTVE